ncbi:odorant receptor 85c-like [Chironomus tepperi]|uniref:odorant receptor 85c-like n=1 Tax=Chironomus tepperi TaxID=113505 RepID=UPI00391F9DD6
MLRMAGLEFSSAKEQQNLRQKVNVMAMDIYYLIMATNHLIFFILTSTSIYNSMHHKEDYFYLIRSISSVGAFCIRVYYIFIKKLELGKILELLNNSYSKEQIIYYKLERYIKVLKIISSYCILSCIMLVTSAVISPVTLWILTGKLTFLNFTPFYEGSFASLPEIYPLIWIWSNLLFTYMMCASIGYTFMLAVTLVSLSIEFKILKMDMMNLKVYKMLSLSKPVKVLVDRQNKLYRQVDMVEKTYSILLLLDFCEPAFNACFTAMVASITTQNSTIIENVSNCLLYLSKIFIQCYFGEMLRNASASLADGIYDCDWETAKDMEVRKSFVLMIMRAKRPATLTCWKFSTVRLEQFYSVR